MKLQLKHLVPYLPYGLECNAMGEMVIGTEYDDKPIPIKFELLSLNLKYGEVHEVGRDIATNYLFCDLFPILRPLSDLTNEIKINGEWVIPMDLLGEDVNQFCDVDFVSDWSQRGGNFNDYVNEFINKKFGNHHLSFLPYGFIQKLLEWHFDVFGLIESGLAVKK